jgi:very-long-chain (3R)-3-hydroxyacyl-CoA dehydratase
VLVCIQVRTHWAFTGMVLAWSITEVIRYLYYFFNLSGGVPYALLWCRCAPAAASLTTAAPCSSEYAGSYTFFYVLYPVGVSGELILCFLSLPYLAERRASSSALPVLSVCSLASCAGPYSLSMPNQYNFAFDYSVFLVCFMIFYLPGFPQLYNYMRKQRVKYLGGTASEKKAQ